MNKQSDLSISPDSAPTSSALPLVQTPDGSWVDPRHVHRVLAEEYSDIKPAHAPRSEAEAVGCRFAVVVELDPSVCPPEIGRRAWIRCPMPDLATAGRTRDGFAEKVNAARLRP